MRDMNRKGLVFLLILLLLALLGCGQKAAETKSREGVVYMDPNAAKATAAPAAPRQRKAALRSLSAAFSLSVLLVKPPSALRSAPQSTRSS